MAVIDELRDDFALPELDTSKWVLTGTNFLIDSPNGAKFTLPSAINSYTTMTSVDSYEMPSRSIYFKVDFNAKFNGYGKLCLVAPSTQEWGVMITSRNLKESANVASVNTATNTITVSGTKTWKPNQWRGSYLYTQGAEYKIVSNAIASGVHTIQTEESFIDVPPNGSSFPIYTPEVKLYTRSPAGVYTIHKTFTWNENDFRWFKILRDGNRMLWYTSRDAINWTVRDFVSNSAVTGLTTVKFYAQFSKVYPEIVYGNPQSMTVRYVNTTKNLDRGSGYLTDNMESYPIRSLIANKQWGVFKEIAGTGAQIITGKSLMLKSSTVRSNLRTTIKDLDWRFDLKIAGTSATVFWRYNDSTTIKPPMTITGTNYVGLQVFPTHMTLFTMISGARSDVEDFTVDSDPDVLYNYRIVHAGSTVVVYRNDGQNPPGDIQRPVTYPVELFRKTNVGTVRDKGHIGILASTSDVTTDNWRATPGVVPPVLTGGPSTAVGSLPLPPMWPFTSAKFVGRISSMRLVEDGYASLVLWPSPALHPEYGGYILQDYDLGEPEYRTFKVDLSGISGTNNYTSMHGEKVITMQLAALPGVNTSVNELADLLARWCAPHRRPMLYYTPVGQPERFVRLVPSPLGRPVPVDQHDFYTTLSATWVVPSGVEENLTANQVLIDPSATEDFTQSVTIDTFGSKIAMPTIYIYGPCIDPIVYNDSIEGNGQGQPARLGLTGEIKAGEYIKLDYKDRTVRLLGSADESANKRYMLTSRAWFGLIPISNNIRFESADGLGKVIIEWRDAW